LRAAFPPPLRQTEGLIGSTVQLVGLAVPDHCTISWRAKTVRPPTTVTSSDGAVELLIDSTSVKLCGPGEWLAKKHGIQSRRAWKKLRVGLGAFIGRIVTATRQWHNHHRRREWGGVVAPTLCGLRFQVSDVRLLVVGDGLEVTRLSDELDSQDDR
jgi:hypothetical protein